jgi:cytochrome oxidase Cu insertion factor (SCO1/SenC/PrrC family)
MRSLLATVLGATVAALVGGCASTTPPTTADDHLYPVRDFTLTERSGKTVRRDDLRGKVWVAAFVFTRCAGPCRQISGAMARLQHDFADEADVRLVSLTVDPAYDTPQVLRDYASQFQADSEKWLFLTGKPDQVYDLIGHGFYLTAKPNEGADRTPGNEVMHDTRLAVVDQKGEIRGYFDGTNPEDISRLERKVRALLQEKA